MAGTVRGGLAEPARGGEWHQAHVPVRGARSRAGVCRRREPPGPQAHPMGQLIPGGLEASVPSVQQ
eukprot:13486115-Alexandrium_andersonii.AAC.1